MPLQVLINPECSKCRNALETLSCSAEPFGIRMYLTDRLTADELRVIVAKLGILPEELVRKNEVVFTEKFSNQLFTNEAWIDILVEHPELIQRPIIIRGNKAVLGRTQEAIEEFLNIKPE